MKINCDKCYKELMEAGALLFSPPNDGICKKIHICKECYANCNELADLRLRAGYYQKLESDKQKSCQEYNLKISELQAELSRATSQNKIAVEALEKLARLGNGKEYGNSTGNVIAKQCLKEIGEEK